MAPAVVNACVVSQLRQHVHYSLDNNLLKNALFLAERLVAYDHGSKDKESTYLLALCHLRLGDNHSAYEYSKDGLSSRSPHLGCAYVFAQACLAIDKNKDGINALEKLKALWLGRNNYGRHTPSSRPQSPDAAAVYCLLGKLYYGYNEPKKAASYFEQALKLNPFMWDAFTNLSDLGVQITVPKIFRIKPEMESILKSSASDQGDSQHQAKDTTLSMMLDHVQNRPGARPISVLESAADPFDIASSRGIGAGIFSSFGTSLKLNESNPSLVNLPAAGGGGIGPEAMETPNGPSASIDITTIASRRDAGVIYLAEPPHAPLRKPRLPGAGLDFSTEAPPKMNRNGSKRPNRAPDHAEESAAAQALRSHNILPPKRTVSGQVVPRQASEDPGAPQRRSVRLFNQIRPASSKSSINLTTLGPQPGRELKKTRPPISRISRPNSTAATVGRQVSGNRIAREDSMDIDQRDPIPKAPTSHTAGTNSQPKPAEPSSAKQEEGLKYLLDLFTILGNGYYSLSRFQCRKALEDYKTLPKAQQDTPWVMAQMGRALYEQAAYAEAEEYYKRIRQKAPTRFADMEIYSTILWHLKKETDLAFLAHELIDSSWQSPEAWCALGNSWSLARDHEQALRCFKRATQLNPKFAYAFTLQGHEHVANEEYEKAQTSYRQGIAADPRHYNAWYGVGRVYEKLGNFDRALSHFNRAADINKTNAVLICCIGTVLEKQKKTKEALIEYTKATDLAPRSALTRFKKARALMALGDTDTALQELMILKDIAPDEAMVHFLLGRLYKNLREKGAAVKYFTIALNLDPKASQQIKEAIESLENDTEDETSMLG